MSLSTAESVFGDLLSTVDSLLPRGMDGLPDVEREHADVVRDLLAYLAEQMTRLHTARQAEVGAFIDWLESSIACSIDDLSGKSFVFDYYSQAEGVDKLLDVLQRNRSRTGMDASPAKGYREQNENRARIVAGYDRSMAVLQPILLQLELTERLIDLIVYRLYGLDEDEARLVDEVTGYGAPASS